MMMKAMIAALAVICSTASVAEAEVVHLHATLAAASEVPPNDGAGQGDLTADLDTDTKALTYRATYSGLSGPATAAHFHGPAPVGVNAGVMVPMKSLASPITGQATLTDAQIADLRAAQWYFNVHTKAHRGGEIRGQVMPAQP